MLFLYFSFEFDGDSWIATLLRARRAIGASLRGQTTVGWRGLAPRDQEQRTLARTSPWIRTRRLHCCTAAAVAAVSHVVTHKLPRHVDSSALGTSLRRQTRGKSALARTLGSYAQCSASSASLRGARIQQQPFVSAFARISARTINLIFPHGTSVSICQFTSEKAIGLKSEAQKSNRIGNGLVTVSLANWYIPGTRYDAAVRTISYQVLVCFLPSRWILN